MSACSASAPARAILEHLVDRARIDVPVAVCSPCRRRMLSSRKTSLPRTRRNPIRERVEHRLVFDQSPEESLTPATVTGNFFSNRSISASVIAPATPGMC